MFRLIHVGVIGGLANEEVYKILTLSVGRHGGIVGAVTRETTFYAP